MINRIVNCKNGVKITGVIPARMESSRFPGKPLFEIAGKPLIKWVYDACQKSKMLDRVVIATDSIQMMDYARSIGVEALETSSECHCGSERIAEIAENDGAEYFVNIQADEPLIQAWMIDAMIERMLVNKADMATIISPVANNDEYRDENTVKVVCNSEGYALYFSRAPIPSMRRVHSSVHKHIGIYGFNRKALEVYSTHNISSLEYAESLEQLRALEYGLDILCVNIPEASELLSVNSNLDVAEVEKMLIMQEQNKEQENTES